MKFFNYWPQVLVTIAASCGAFIYGITLGWSAPSQVKLLSPDNDFEMTRSEFSWATSLMPLGSAFFCVLSGLVRNRLGTKITILIFVIPNLAGWILLIFAWRPMMVMLGRFLIGAAGGAYMFNVPVFVSELASKEIRGILVTFVQVFLESGILFVYTLGSLVDYVTLNITCACLLIIYTVGFMFLPETPVFLVRKNKIDEAETTIKTLRGRFYDSKSEIMEIQKGIEEAEKVKRPSFIEEIRKPETLKAFIIIMCVFVFFQFSGINAITFYATDIFLSAGITAIDPSHSTIIIGVTMVIVTTSTAAFIDRFGRVFLLTTSFIFMTLGLIIIASYFYISNSFGGLDWLPLPAMCIFVIGFSIGIGPVPYVLLGEIFSSDAKRIVAPFAQTLNFVMCFGVGILYPAMTSGIGNGATFFTFAAVCFLGLLFTIFVIPETKGKSLTEIQTLLKDSKTKRSVK